MTEQSQPRTLGTRRATAAAISCVAVSIPGCSAQQTTNLHPTDRNEPQMITFSKFESKPNKNLKFDSTADTMAYSHVRVVYDLPPGSPTPTQEFHMLVGLEGPGSMTVQLQKHSFQPVPEPLDASQPMPSTLIGASNVSEDQDLNGPALTLNVGWSFITFRWPLIWVRNIEAGSIGTTAIARWDNDVMYVYLVRNGIESYEPNNPNPPLVTDVSSGLEINAKPPFATPAREYVTFQGRPDVHIVRRSFSRVTHGPSAGNLQTQGTTDSGVWKALEETFSVNTQPNGTVTVSGGGVAGETQFLTQVLNLARTRALYRQPLD